MLKAIRSFFAEPITVKQVHAEFDSAVDKLISKALDIKNADKEKHDKLIELGFNKSKHVKNMKAIMDEKEKNEKISSHVNYYRQFYPFNKFITAELAEKICSKYGLVLGDAFNFIGEIPEKNIKEIASFVLRNEDKTKHQLGWWKYHYTGMSIHYYGSHKEESGARYGRPFGTHDMFGGTTGFISRSEDQKEEFEQPPFKMVAPVKDFDMTGKRVSGVYIQDVPDPIVLQPVNGGYIIVSKWGDEASDEALVNETMN